MRISFAVFTLIACVIATSPSFAGNATYTDGRGAWKTTKCQPPAPPAALAHDPESAANDLNKRMTEHNAFVAASQAYMDCISQEAQFDATAAAQIITRSAQGLIQSTQAAVAASAQAAKKPAGAMNDPIAAPAPKASPTLKAPSVKTAPDASSELVLTPPED